MILVGFIWLLNDLHILSWGHSWPLFMIAAGLMMFFRRTLYPGYGFGQYPGQYPGQPGAPPAAPTPPPGFDPRDQRRYYRDQARAQRDAFRAQRQQMRYQMRSMRRGSVLGPIVLISVGVVFLLIQTGRIDHQRFMDWYGNWWPLLLVAAGILVFAEWALDQFLLRDPQRPPYRRSFGGAVVLLLVVLCVAGAAVRIHGDRGRFFGPPFFLNMDNS